MRSSRMGRTSGAARRETAIERLASDLYVGDLGDPIAEELAGWLAASARFRSFAETNRDKIRKKLRLAPDSNAMRDVRAELQVAHLLLADRRIELAFEAYGARTGGPDFTATYRGGRSFNVEVTRVRGDAGSVVFGWRLLAKLRQLPPSAPNALVLAIEGDTLAALDVDAAVRALRARADAKDEAFFKPRGFESARSFYDRFLRLGGVIAWSEDTTADTRATLWVNRSARIPLPDGAARACLRCLASPSLS
jgi:hypothetical protein